MTIIERLRQAAQAMDGAGRIWLRPKDVEAMIKCVEAAKKGGRR